MNRAASSAEKRSLKAPHLRRRSPAATQYHGTYRPKGFRSTSSISTQFALLNYHVAVLFVLVAFDQLVARDRLVLGLAVQDLFDTRVIALMELIETDRLAARGGVKLNRNRDQAEGDVRTETRSAGKE